MTDEKFHRIREMAYRIWMDEGCPHGRDMDHWLRAQYAVDSIGSESPYATSTSVTEVLIGAEEAAEERTRVALARPGPKATARKRASGSSPATN
ncbi:MAG: DUF2934 domain-containing protein [Betaproteobacteria bacterium]|nr:DUF2934 domain-containing protein [Betaproteobacteria bacterium]